MVLQEAIKHIIELRQCALFVDSKPLAKAMTDAADFIEKLTKTHIFFVDKL